MSDGVRLTIRCGHNSLEITATSFRDLHKKCENLNVAGGKFTILRGSSEEITEANFSSLRNRDTLVVDTGEAAMNRLAADLGGLSIAREKKFKLADFELKQTVGTGTFGRVLLSVHTKTGTNCVLKVLRKTEILRQKQLEHIISEKTILASIHHPFIVNMFGCFQDDINVYMVIEFVVGGELFTYLGRYGKFTKEMVQFYAGEIVLVLQYLHGLETVYRDLKPENILLDRHGHVKITDFGFAKKLEDRTYTVCGTMDYLAPEIIKKSGHGFGVDFWALGVLIFEMLTGFPPFYDENPLKSCEKIMAGGIDFPPDLDAASQSIIESLLTSDLTHRLGCLRRGFADIKEHAFFAGLDWQRLLERRIPPPIQPEVSSDADPGCYDVYDEEDILAPSSTPVDQSLFRDFDS